MYQQIGKELVMDNESAFLDLAEIVFKDELFPLVFMAEDPEVVPGM